MGGDVGSSGWTEVWGKRNEGEGVASGSQDNRSGRRIDAVGGKCSLGKKGNLMGRWDDPRTEWGRYVGLTEGRGRWGAWKLGIDGMFRKGVGRGMDGTEVQKKRGPWDNG